MKKRYLGLPVLVLASLVATGCGSIGAHHTDPSMVALRYAGGATEGGKFKECVKPGEKQVGNDDYYNYPTTQRENVWDSENFEQGSKSADHNDLRVTDKDGNTATLKIKVVFTLNTECKTLRKFHDTIGKTRGAWFDKDGKYGAGWLWAMDNYISSATSDLARRAAIKHTVEELWLKPESREELAEDIMKDIQAEVDKGTEGDEQFYRIGDVRIFGAEPSGEFQELYSERKAAQVKAQTAKANQEAQVAEARAATAVAEEKAKTMKAEAAGYGSYENYLKKLAIEKGMNPWQPTVTSSRVDS